MGMIQNDWLQPLSPEFRKPYYAELFKLEYINPMLDRYKYKNGR